MQPTAGMKLGAYQIVEQIGQGGMATVYKAYQASMDRYVAVKVLPAHLSQDQTFVARFNQEARTLAHLEHPHILPVHDYGAQDGLTYLVMRYVEGGTLKEMIAREGPPDLREAARVFDQVAGALDYAHSQGVLHRDIKPSNVLVDRRRDTFLTDFGIAKLVAETAQYTASGAVIGTPAYMAPEQGLGQPVDARSDLYALGVLLYEMVTGRVPYEAETPLAVVLKHINEPLPMPRQARPDLPEVVERVILKAMSKAPADRWQTPREMADALSQAVASLPAEVALAKPKARVAAPTDVWEYTPATAGSAAGAPADRLTEAEPAAGPAAVPEAEPRAPVARRARPPAPAPAAARRRRLPRWLPIAAGAAVLIALAAVLAAVLGGGGGAARTAATLPPATATREAPPVAQATETAALPSPEPSPSAVPAPARPAAGWTSYTNANLALSVARQEGILWVGSESGLVRWDLAAGTYAKLGVADGLASGRVNDLLVDQKGRLWAATAAGISLLDAGRWTTFDEADGLDSQWIETLIMDEGGVLGAGSAGGTRGLSVYEGAGWIPLPVSPIPVAEPSITSMAGDEQAGFYVGLEYGGLAHLSETEWTVRDSRDGLPGDTVLALALTGDALWAAFYDVLVRFDRVTGDWQKVQEVTVYAILAASDGSVWFGTAEGVLSFDPSSGDWQPFEAGRGRYPGGGPVTDIAGDGATVWFSTYGGGVVSYDGTDWKTWRTEDRIGGNTIDAVRQAPDGAVWFTHAGTGLSRYDPASDAWRTFGEAEGAADWASAPGFDGEGNVWIAWDNALARYDGVGWQAFETPEVGDVGVGEVEIGPGGVQWLRTDAGLVRHDPQTDTWTSFGGDDHPVLADVHDLLLAGDGTVWAGGEGGLVRYDGVAWSAVGAEGSELRDVKDLAEAPDGSLWLAADGNLIHLAGGKQYVVRWPDEGYIDRLAVAPDGSVWAGYDGVGRYDPGSGTWEVWSAADGLVTDRVTALAVTPDGTVWIGTEGGVSCYVPPGP